MAAVTSLVTATDADIGRTDDTTSHFLCDEIQPHEGKKEKTDGPSDEAWDPLFGDASLWHNRFV